MMPNYLNKKFKNDRQAQTFVEYTIVIGIIIIIMFAMTPLLRRGIQGMIRVTADQVGVQKDADQRFEADAGGHLASSYSTTRAIRDTEVQERLGVTNHIYHLEEISINSISSTDLGFSQQTGQ